MAPLLLLLCILVAAGLYLVVIVLIPILLVRLGVRHRSSAQAGAEPRDGSAEPG